MNHSFARYIIMGGITGALILFEYVAILDIYWGKNTDFLLITGLVDLISGGIVGVIGGASSWFMRRESNNRNAEPFLLLMTCIIAAIVFYCCGWMRENWGGDERLLGIIPYIFLVMYHLAVIVIDSK